MIGRVFRRTLTALLLFAAAAQAQLRAPDVHYEPSAPSVVKAMLEIGEVRAACAWTSTRAA